MNYTSEPESEYVSVSDVFSSSKVSEITKKDDNVDQDILDCEEKPKDKRHFSFIDHLHYKKHGYPEIPKVPISKPLSKARIQFNKIEFKKYSISD